MDIVITLIQVSVLIVIFASLNWLVGQCCTLLLRSRLRPSAEKISTLRGNLGLLLLIGGVFLCFTIVAVNSYLIYQGQRVWEVQLGWLRSIPIESWQSLATAIGKIVVLLTLVKVSLPHLQHLLDRAARLARDYDRITANDDSITAFFAQLKGVMSTSIWLGSGILCTQFLQLPEAIPRYLSIALKAYVAIAIGRLLVKSTSVLVDTLDALSLQYSSPDNILRYYDRFRHLLPTLKKCLEYVLYVGIATLIIHDIEFINWIAQYADEIIFIIGIYFLCGVLIELANVVLEDLVLQTDHLTELQLQRRLTIIPLFKSFLKYAVYFSALLLILKLINLDPAPLLAGAGIVGIVVGFGAQNLINDIVCGFFILFENYYLVGDYIETGKLEERSVEGIVEAIELRTTHIRHPDGQLQIVRNGEIGSIVNYSKQYTYARVDIPVAYTVNLDHAYQTIEQVGQQLFADCADVLEPTMVDGLENFGEQNLVLRTLTKVKPGKHLYIQRLLRRNLKLAFDQQEITLSL